MAEIMTPALATVIAAGISAGVTLIISAMSQHSQIQKIINELNRNERLLNYRIDRLEQKVDMYNTYDSRIARLEERAGGGNI
ncbi:MAG: hypothetical protein K6G90_06150 [Clostridia bacterium]|nr:hypothetical protein [Clostridia bacterium]